MNDRAALMQQIADAARARGIDPRLPLAIVAQESGFNPTLRPYSNGRLLSSAYGLFQLLTPEQQRWNAGPGAPIENQIAGGLTKTAENIAAARRALNRDPTPGELYVMHYQGIGAGPRILSNPGGGFVDTLNTIRPGWGQTVLRANPWLANITTNQDFINWSNRRMEQRLAQTGYGGTGAPAVAALPSGRGAGAVALQQARSRAVPPPARALADPIAGMSGGYAPQPPAMSSLPALSAPQDGVGGLGDLFAGFSAAFAPRRQMPQVSQQPVDSGTRPELAIASMPTGGGLPTGYEQPPVPLGFLPLVDNRLAGAMIGQPEDMDILDQYAYGA